MGHLEFGNLCRTVGITYFTISPYEQRALAGVLNPGVKNTLRRFREKFFFYVIPLVTILTIREVANDIYYKSHRKNPDDYINDV